VPDKVFEAPPVAVARLADSSASTRTSCGPADERPDSQRRYAILLTVLAQSATDVLDEVVQLFDQAISARESKAERTMRDALAERGKAGEDRQALLDDLLTTIFDVGVDDEAIGGLIRGDRIGWPRLLAARGSGDQARRWP
jgi:hypothetical protein